MIVIYALGHYAAINTDGEFVECHPGVSVWMVPGTYV